VSKAKRRARLSPHRQAMTLVEVMIAMALIAIVATMCVAAFMMVIGAEMRETNTRLASEKAEERIAAGDEPTTKMAVDLQLGGYTIPWTGTETYEETAGTDAAIATENGQIDVSGSRSYTILKGNEPERLVFNVKVTDSDRSFIIPTSGYGAAGGNTSYHWLIDWGDNRSAESAEGLSTAGNPLSGIGHDYPGAGEYTITIWPYDGKSKFEWARAFGFSSSGTYPGSSHSTNKAKVTSVIEMPTKGFLESATRTGSSFLRYTWYGCKSLTIAVVPDTSGWNITSIGDCFLYDTWRECTSLITAAVPDTSGWDVESIGVHFLRDAWHTCSSLVTAVVPDTSGWDISSVPDYFLYNTWYGCSSLTTATVPDTSGWDINSIGNYFLNGAWQNCTALTTATVPATSGWEIQSINSHFLYCTWYGCSSLINAAVPDTSKWEIRSIGAYFLYGAWNTCSSLTSAPAPDMKDWAVTGIGGYSFYETWKNCNGIKDISDVRFPDALLNVEPFYNTTTILRDAFSLGSLDPTTSGNPPSFYTKGLITQKDPLAGRLTFRGRIGMNGYDPTDPDAFSEYWR
jgi:prepilin-type N-terminal cleavage/methylation domain-containing protein